MPAWNERELEHGTVWCETQLDNAEIWLEWNDRVMAYRFGIVRNGQPSKSSLGFADSLEAAKLTALEELARINFLDSSFHTR
jgi:hypothetical protein